MRVFAFLALLFALVRSGAGAAPLPRTNAPTRAMMPVTLDGTALGSVGIARASEAPLVAVERLAAALGWKATPLTAALRLVGDDRTIVLIAGSRMIREYGELRLAFLEPVLLRGGHWYVRANEAGRIFGLRVRAGTTIAFTHPEQVSSVAEVREVPRPVKPRPAPTPRAIARNAPSGMQGSPAGRVVISFERSGGSQFIQFASQTSGAALQTTLTASGTTSLQSPYATVLLGSVARNATLGMQTDPLNGAIFRSSIFEGVSLNRADAHRSFFVGRRLDSGIDMIGETIGDPLHGGATTVATLVKSGAYDQTIVRHLTRIRKSWGDFTTETIGGDRGAAIGIGARTRGRTFLDAQANVATRGLPLGNNDAPISAAIGRALSPGMTVTTGFGTGPQQPIAPFVGVSAHSGALSESISVTNRSLSASAAYQTSFGSFQAFVVPGVQRFAGLSGSFYLPAATVDVASTMSQGTRDSSITAHTNRRGINAVAGVGIPAGGRVGPIAGLIVPLTSLVAVEGTLRPSSGGRQAIRMSLALGIPGRRRPAEPVMPARVHVVTPTTQPLRLFVDGVPVRRFTTADVMTDVTRGAHLYSVETEDGTYGSLEVSAAASTVGQSVTVTLLPMRTIRGRVVLPVDAGLPVDFNLAGIAIVLEPSHVTVETAPDGTFFFAPQPIGPDATIGIDPALVPREVRAPDAQAIGDNPILLQLLPALRVERTVFPDSH